MVRFSRRSGFSVIEVMIVVAIIGILAAIAYPSYAEHVRRGQRAEARTALLEAAQYMQRFYAANDSYSTTRSNEDVKLPASLAKVPSSGTVRYSIALADDLSRTSFTLQAVPEGAMAGDKCGTFTLTSTGIRNVASASAPVAECWR
jgi:type IV pilus assembly protein PilE